MRDIASGTSLIDVRFMGSTEYIACYVLETTNGIALIDPGPTSCLRALDEGLRLAGLSLDAVTDLLITHIHLDHAGAAGTILRANPRIRVHVHERGARHMVDPSRLLASASRLYGNEMERLWGEVAPVPEEAVNVLAGGERLRLGARELEVQYTPGHAAHHVSYFDPATGVAFVGDTLGIRIDNRAFVLPVTPPPDIDLEAWAESHATIRAWGPDLLCPTHFGPARPVADHIDEHEKRLRGFAMGVDNDLNAGTEPGAAAEAFAGRVRKDLGQTLGLDSARGYSTGGGLRDSWHGLARALRTRNRRESSV